MAIDARKHVAPAAAETPRRQAINDLSLSIRDPIPVANVTERAQVLTDLTAAGVGPSVTNPVYFHRADLPPRARTEFTDDGTNFYLLNPGGIFAALEKTTAQAIAPATDATIAAYTVTETSGCTLDNSTGVVTVPLAGRYRVMFSFDWTANGTGARAARVTRNGTAYANSILADDHTNTGNRVTPMRGSRVVRLTANDTLQIRIVHSGSVNIGPDYSMQPLSFSVEYAGA
jgi:hypothetical protein